jgi:hypothetical protein
VTAVPAAANAQGVTLTRTNAIVTAVDRRNADGLALLERLVSINSGTANHAGVAGRRCVNGSTPSASPRGEDATAVDRAEHLVAGIVARRSCCDRSSTPCSRATRRSSASSD